MKRFFIAAAILLSIGSFKTYAQNINSDASFVEFSISNMKFKTVEGTFKGMKGEVKFDIDDLVNSSMNVCISSASVNTGNEKRDEHLRKDDFFNCEKYPDICFKSTSITKEENGFIVSGEMSLHGITKQVEIPFNYSNNTFKGSFKINRKDYGVGGNGTFMVGDEVTLNITCKIE